MIPYFELREIPIGGGHTVAVFGVLVVAGIILGIFFAEARARALGIPEERIRSAIAWALIPGLLVSHWEVLLLEPLPSDLGPWIALEFWNGMSSFGGFLGAFLGLSIYFGLRREAWLAEAEVLVQAIVVTWVFGRLGCALVHDHIGALSAFPLAIQFPGGPRHDLGLYEFLYTVFVLVPAVLVLNRRPRFGGATIATVALLYAPARFLGDFLRNTDLPGADSRYLGFTPAQYGCLALAVVGLAFASRRKRVLQ